MREKEKFLVVVEILDIAETVRDRGGGMCRFSDSPKPDDSETRISYIPSDCRSGSGKRYTKL